MIYRHETIVGHFTAKTVQYIMVMVQDYPDNLAKVWLEYISEKPSTEMISYRLK